MDPANPIRSVALIFCLGWLAAGCANYLAPFAVRPAHPGITTHVSEELASLPPPEEPVVVAVYRFRDQTGQYKLADNTVSWSTAVTQGSTSILMRALEESGWFIPIEREGLSNLLNERQIIQSIRAQHTGPDGEPLGPLPPLLYAGVMLEGGIIGYDSNVITGGAGVRYFGAGAAGQFRQDQVSIYLRAVSTQSGRVLKTVNTTKTIVSQKVDGGLFRYVDLKRILETEVGYTFNEPPVLAVTEAIEEAVKALIIEGVREQLWSLKDPADATAEAFLAYERDVEEAREIDYFARHRGSYRGAVGMAFLMGAQQYRGNYLNPLTEVTGEVQLLTRLSQRTALQASVAVGQIGADQVFRQTQWSGELLARYYLLPFSRLSPFVTAGGGMLVHDWQEGMGDGVFATAVAGAGIEYMLSRGAGFNIDYRFNYALNDGMDGVRAGRFNDSVWSLRMGITLYSSLF